jgi:prefoldin alpha subunit
MNDIDKEQMYEYKILEQQLSQIQESIEQAQQSILQLEKIKESIYDFSKLKKGDKIEVPMANGIFASAIVDDNTYLKINVGNNVVVEKSVNDAIKLIDEQIVEVEGAREHLMTNFEMLITRAKDIEEKIEKGQKQNAAIN